MTILKTKWGDEIDTEKIPKGFGNFTRYVQKHYDSLFGKQTTDKTKYKVTLSAKKEVTACTYITVEADSMKDAERQAMEQVKGSDRYQFDWEDTNDSLFIDDIEVDDCEELEEE